MTDIIKIDKKEIATLVNEGGKMIFKKSAEDELLKLLKIKDEIDTAIETVKENIFKAGRSITLDFTGVIGDRVKCVVRKYGDRYKTTNADFEKTISFKRADSDKIDEYITTNGKLPEGVVEKEREEKLTIIVPNEQHTPIGKISA